MFYLTIERSLHKFSIILLSLYSKCELVLFHVRVRLEHAQKTES